MTEFTIQGAGPLHMDQAGRGFKDATILDSTDVALVVSAPDCRVSGLHIKGCAKAAIMLLPGADHFVMENCVIQDYNRSNTNGQAAFFMYGAAGPISDVRVINCRISNGNGNTIRAQNVKGLHIIENDLSDTRGNSSEGLAFNPECEFIRILRNRVRNAFVDGILFFGTGHRDVWILENSISNSGQRRDGTHPAIAVDPQAGGVVAGFLIQDNLIFDDQVDTNMKPAPTQNCALMTRGAGQVRAARRAGNLTWGMPYADFWVPQAGSTTTVEWL